MNPETKLKNKVIKCLQSLGSEVWFYKTNDRFRSGILDFILCINGKFYSLELKVGKNKPTRLQEHTILKITSSGGIAQVCYSLEDVKNILHSGK